MLDPRWVREHAGEVRRAAVRKRIDADVDAFLREDRLHREVLQRLETLRAAQKARARAMAALDPEARKRALAGLGRDKAELKRLEEEEQGLRRRVRALALRLPMPPAPGVPDGRDDGDNRELRRCGSPPRFSFPSRSHVEIGERLGILDIPRGVRLAGTRNYLLAGDGALLEQAVLRLAVDHMLERGFRLVSVPALVQDAFMEGTGYYPGGEEQAYRIPGEGLSLIGTAEVCLTSLHAGEVLQEDDLPLRMVALSPCFRREAGAAGRDTKGLYRVHQFWKVEQVVIGPAREDWSREEHQRILEHATALLDRLGLPYRVVDVCTGDLGQGQVQKFDVETWMPSREAYGETHSASRFHDFQARRLNLRYRPSGGGKPLFCHTLNNTVVASPRILIALLENFQEEDGGVIVPGALRPYLGKDRLAPAAAGVHS
ncbi:MAG: serine--tRNA ligase [Planctomycetota bacterium]